MMRKEWWIAFNGDPSKDDETYKRYVGRWPFTGVRIPGEDIIHMIEIETGEIVLSKAKLREALAAGSYCNDGSVDWEVVERVLFDPSPAHAADKGEK